jgi:hypothetical protein
MGITINDEMDGLERTWAVTAPRAPVHVMAREDDAWKYFLDGRIRAVLKPAL